MIDNFKDLRTILYSMIADIANESQEKAEKDFLSQLSDHDRMIYLAGVKAGLYQVKRIIE